LDLFSYKVVRLEIILAEYFLLSPGSLYSKSFAEIFFKSNFKKILQNLFGSGFAWLGVSKQMLSSPTKQQAWWMKNFEDLRLK